MKDSPFGASEGSSFRRRGNPGRSSPFKSPGSPTARERGGAFMCGSQRRETFVGPMGGWPGSYVAVSVHEFSRSVPQCLKLTCMLDSIPRPGSLWKNPECRGPPSAGWASLGMRSMWKICVHSSRSGTRTAPPFGLCSPPRPLG